MVKFLPKDFSLSSMCVSFPRCHLSVLLKYACGKPAKHTEHILMTNLSVGLGDSDSKLGVSRGVSKRFHTWVRWALLRVINFGTLEQS